MKNAGAFLPHAVADVLEGMLGVFGDRLGRLLFKLVVEHNMTNHLLGGDIDMTRDEYNKMRGSSVRGHQHTGCDLAERCDSGRQLLMASIKTAHRT